MKVALNKLCPWRNLTSLPKKWTAGKWSSIATLSLVRQRFLLPPIRLYTSACKDCMLHSVITVYFASKSWLCQFLVELLQIALDLSESIEANLQQVKAFRSTTATCLVHFVGELSGIYRIVPFFLVVRSKLFPNNYQHHTDAYLAIGRHYSHSTRSRSRGLKFFFLACS